jgi:hypothetical protein
MSKARGFPLVFGEAKVSAMSWEKSTQSKKLLAAFLLLKLQIGKEPSLVFLRSALYGLKRRKLVN